jgi:hypothetical protein
VSPAADTGVAPDATPDAAPDAAIASGALGNVLDELREEFSQLRDALAAARSTGPSDGNTIVSGAELAAVIEGLGVSLGNGMATLLSDHRALLARDIEAGADRVLEDMGRRLRTATNQTVDGVEAKVRHLTSQNQAVVADQIDARIDQLQSDLSGVRAVMLDLPDHTELITRLDMIADGLAETTAERMRESVSTKVPPAVLSALEDAITEPMARLEQMVGAATEQLAAASEARRTATSGTLDGDTLEADADGMARLTQEVVALRRRIGLRADAPPVELSEEQLDAIADRVVARLDEDRASGPGLAESGDMPAPTTRRAPRKAAAKPAPAKAPSAKASANPARRARNR